MTDALHLYWDMAFLRTRSLFMIGVIFLFNLSRVNRVAEELANVFQSHLRSLCKKTISCSSEDLQC